MFFRNLALLTLASSIAACSTIENPEDCDIRCGFGMNDRFEAENEKMSQDLDERIEENERISERLQSAQIEEATLEEREVNLRSILARQINRLDQLDATLDEQLAKQVVLESVYTSTKAQVAALRAETRAIVSKPKMTVEDMDGATSMLTDKLVPFFLTAQVTQIQDNMS